MSCRHRHGPWCCDDDYYYSYEVPGYPPARYGPAPPPGRSPRGRDLTEELEDQLGKLESELSRVREELAGLKRDTRDPE